jgi:hypothetical protein
MSAVLDQLKAQGYPVDDADVAHLWPANINPYGKYRFNVEGEFHRKGLRPLRQPDSGLAIAWHMFMEIPSSGRLGCLEGGKDSG